MSFTLRNNPNGDAVAEWQTTSSVATTATTTSIDVTAYTKMTITGIVSSFSSGDITASIQTSVDGLNWGAFGSGTTLNGNGSFTVGGGANLDVSSIKFIRGVRGSDANTGAVQFNARLFK